MKALSPNHSFNNFRHLTNSFSVLSPRKSKINAIVKIRKNSVSSVKNKQKVKKQLKDSNLFRRITMLLKNKQYSSVSDIISSLNLNQSKTTITRFLKKHTFKSQSPTKKLY